ncbi:unnamed protein product [Caenorhabditis auriculariae]|uniref:Transcription elongation factor SPT4 n=1 Tax=Caenorhabditis auriculariae TaxID=2777116 RepID=A0A8S1HTU6_9PELO|nr:unnamed protein product [Caenorhabditis auriculariae]
MSVDTIPRDLRGLRACLLCSLIKSSEQFLADGCDNCEGVLHIKNDNERLYDCTSTNFDGMIAAMHPEDSWVCKWQKVNRKKKGIYAISHRRSLQERHARHELATPEINQYFQKMGLIQ